MLERKILPDRWNRQYFLFQYFIVNGGLDLYISPHSICITSIEQELDQIFILTDPEKEIYRCKYCEEKYTNPNRR